MSYNAYGTNMIHSYEDDFYCNRGHFCLTSLEFYGTKKR